MTRPPAHFSGDEEAPMRYWDNEASEAWSTEETIVLAQANQPLVTSPNGVEEVSVRVSEADIFVGKGDKLLQTKDYENAIEQYKKEPSSVEYMDKLCHAHMSIQAWNLSNWCLNAMMLNNRALCEIKLGNYPAAIADCDLALNLYPDL
ncbi:unnamed protein product [Clonostachys rosea f. rosea IK726]|uniref:Uncharacterized protein n=1 Tax=Clonostachys rosea f. rosea IK726 TaxID=1349383 RepID=A0ACA9THC4_BIOOC|nr:unnamed protein product [Clonostachys rosea f. rosea IK726]